jgi:predicted AlkP superfamily pyrophosphatase or phosphodiesterase
MKKFQIVVTIVSMTVFSCRTTEKESDLPLKTIIIFVDGLRPDYITAEQMPNVHKLMSAGVQSLNHHPVFPSVTRVNATSFATGSYPQRHGILGNTIYLPSVNPTKGVDTGNSRELIVADSVLGGKLIAAPSIGEILTASKLNYAVFSTGSTGSSWLLNHRVKGLGIVNPDSILPLSLENRVLEKFGKAPESGDRNASRHAWLTDVIIDYALTEEGPDVSVVWFSDPDGTAHANGVGIPVTMEAILKVDAQIGRITQALEERGLKERVNVLITADHGFVTRKASPGIASFLVERQLKESATSQDVIQVGGAVYLADDQKESLSAIIDALQQEDWVGALFTANGDYGTLPFSSVNWDFQDRTPDLLVDYNWTDEVNEYGYAGYSYGGGVAGHGSSSKYEMSIPLVAFGPSFKQSFQNRSASGTVDLLPTILKIYGIETSKDFDGRVLAEILSDQEDPQREGLGESAILSQSTDSTYRVKVLTDSVPGSEKYILRTETVRGKL